MKDYDLAGALAAGIPESEIVDHLAAKRNYDLKGAREAGVTDREILAHFSQEPPGAIEAGYRGFRRSLGELGVLAGDTLPALAASALLPEEKSRGFVERQFKEAAQTRAELEEAFPTVYGSYKKVDDLSSGIGYVAEKFGEVLPDILPSIASGGIGMFMGKRAAQKAARNAAEEMATKTEMELLEGGLPATAKQAILYKEAADRVGKAAAQSIENDFVKKGLTAGAYLGSFAQNAPEVFENIYEETGQIAPAGAVLFGGLSSMLDAYLPSKLLGQFGEVGKAQLMARMLKDSGASPAVWKAVLREGAKSAAEEGVTEAGQEAISVAAEKFYGSNKDFFDPQNVERYLESFFAGAAGGGALGGVSGVREGMKEKAYAKTFRDLQKNVTPPGGDLETFTEEGVGTEPPPGGKDESDEDVPTFKTILGSQELLGQLGLKPNTTSTIYKGLLGLDMSKPEDVEKAKELVIEAQAKTTKWWTPEKKQKVLDIVNAAIVAAGGAPIELGPRGGGRGEGTSVPGGPGTGTDTGTTTPPDESGVGTDVSTSTGAPGGAPGINTSLDQLSDEELEALIAQHDEKRRYGRDDTLKIGEDVLSSLLAERARRVKERAAPKVTDRPELKEAMKPAFAPEKIEQLYEATRKDQKLPAWRKVGKQDYISKDEQLIFEDALNDFGRYLEEGDSIQDVVDSAFQELKNYRKAKNEQGDIKAGDKAMAISSYEINRGAESTYRGVNLPRWNLLPEPLKKAYLDKVQSSKERTAQYQGPDYETQQAGFDALQEVLEKDFPNMSIKFDRLEEGVFARGEVERQRQAQQKAEDERFGLNQKLPKDIADAVKKGDLKTLLDYLEKDAQGKFVEPVLRFGQRLSELFDPITSRINRVVAGQIKALDLKTELLYDETFQGVAEYDPKTDTIRVGPRGLNEVAVLHELVHAATVNVMFKFLNGRKNELTQAQRDGANRIVNLMNLTRKQLSGQFPQAYKNAYEFIAYAMSDPKFQAELQKRKVPQDMIKFTDFPETETADESISNGWTSFVRSIAQILKLFRRVGKFFRIEGVPNEYFNQSRVKSKKEIEQDLELTDEEKDKLFKEMEAREKDPAYKKLRNKLEQVTKIETGYVQRRNKLAASLISEEKKGLKKEDADKINEFSPKIQNNPEYKKAVADVKRQKDNIQAVLNEIEDAGFGDLLTPETVADVKRGTAVVEDPGYIGNMFLEMTGAFSTILDAPPDGGIPLFSAKPLRVGATATQEQAVAEANEVFDRLKKRNENIAAGNTAKLGELIKGLFDADKRRKYGNYLIQKLQNSKIALNNLEDALGKLGKLVTVGNQNEFNNLATRYARATSMSHSEYLYNIKPLRDEATDILKRIQESKDGMNERDLLALLHTYIIGLHDYERRREKFYRTVPLNDTADAERTGIYRKLASEELIKMRADPATRDQAKARVDQLKKDLVNLINDPTKRKYPNPANSIDPLNDMDSSNYNTLGIDKPVADQFLTRFNNDKDNADIQKFFDKLKEIQDVTQKLNEKANYFQPGVENVIQFYGWKNYFPFKGKPDPTGKSDFLDLTGEKMSGDYLQGEVGYTGRQSDADNPVLQVLVDATRAAMRAGHKDVPHAMKNLIKAGLVAGTKKPKTIKFEDRYDLDFKLADIKKESAFFVYNDDGSIDIYEIHNKDVLRAMKGVFKPDTPLIDMANNITSFFGQMHTRFNPAFAPMDFIRNLFTYSGLIGAKYGPKAGGEVLTNMGKVFADGGMSKAFKFTWAYSKGKIDIEKDAKTALKDAGLDDTPFNRDMFNYYRLGGPTAHIEGLTSAQTLESLAKQVNSNGVFNINTENFTNFFDSWMGMFETTSRIAAFHTVRDRLLKEGATPEAADMQAMAFAKDMANFQQVGDLGKALGSLYMFWRPAATGAVRAIQALAPAFDFRSEERIKQYWKNQTSLGEITDEEAARAAAESIKEIRNARLMGVTMMGAGAFVYMMAYMLAGDDEEDRNKVATDDMARWVRYARFNTGIQVNGRDLVFQLPWGFGPGALASSGAQIMSVAMGGQGFLPAAMNIMDAGFESFVPLPVSKIDKTQNPTAWVVDSLAPSSLRPLLEFSMNTDSLGRKIYSDRQSRYADAFLGGDNVPLMYKDAAQGIFSTLGVDISPGSIYFFANNYLDGLTRAIGTTYNLGNVIAGRKDFDPRTDTLFLDAYLKAPSNYDAMQFTKAENKIKEMEKGLKTLEGTSDYMEYLADHPMDKQIVNFYNKTVNGQLRILRAQANAIRRSPDMSPKEKQEQLQLNIKHQNQIKSAFTSAMRGLDPRFDSIGNVGEE